MPSEKLRKISMYEFTAAQQKKALFWLVLFHIFIIAASNYLVQFPFQIFGIFTTWGAFSFPFIFLATDLTVRIFGAPLARRIIFWVMFPALLLSYVFSVLFHEGNWTGWASLTEFNTFVGRIALASFRALCLGDSGNFAQAGQVFGTDGLGLAVEGLATLVHQGGGGNEQADAPEAVSEELTLLVGDVAVVVRGQMGHRGDGQAVADGDAVVEGVALEEVRVLHG